LRIFQRKYAFPLLILIAACLIFTGCQFKNSGGSNSGANMVHLYTPTKQFTSTATATITPAVSSTPTLTQTPENTATPTETATPVSTATPLPTPTPLPPPFLDTFIENLKNGNAGQVVGVYVEDVLSLRVVQQPSSDAAYVSSLPNTATYFGMVRNITGNTGLLAHNYLSGAYFFNLRSGQSVTLIYGDGTTDEYYVSYREEFQALSPNSPTSNFVSLSSGETLSSTDLFYRVYGGGTRTTFQTCIAQGNEDSWGRLFVIAPLE
jgi:hypothetical protein